MLFMPEISTFSDKLWWRIGGFASAPSSQLPPFACPFSRLGPLPARKSTGLSPDGRALAGSIPLIVFNQKNTESPLFSMAFGIFLVENRGIEPLTS